MRKIVDYNFVSVSTKMSDLVPLVRDCIKHEWEPLGSPVLSDQFKYQFLVKYEEIT